MDAVGERPDLLPFRVLAFRAAIEIAELPVLLRIMSRNVEAAVRELVEDVELFVRRIPLLGELLGLGIEGEDRHRAGI